MNKRTKELLQDLGCPEHKGSELPEALNIQTDRIKQIVNQTLDTVPQERNRYTKQKRTKALVILVAILVLTTTTVLAATRFDGFLKLFFSGDFSSLEPHIKTPYESVTDGSFTLTLEQVLAYERRVLILYSVESETTEAQAELMRRDFFSYATVELPENVRFSVGQHGEVEELKTETKRFFTYALEGMNNYQKQPLSFSLNIMNGEDRFIEIEIEDVVEQEIDVTLTTPTGSLVVVKLSPLDLSLEMEVSDQVASRKRYEDVYFRLQDGSIKKHKVFYQWQSGVLASEGIPDDGPRRYRDFSVARELVDITQFKSIILAGVEYDLHDPAQVRVLPENELARPFRQSLVYHDDYLLVPLVEVMEKLGGTITFDQTGASAVIEYRDSTYEIQAGADDYQKDGQVVSFPRKPSVIMLDGTLLMERFCFQLAFELDIAFELAEQLEDSTLYIMP